VKGLFQGEIALGLKVRGLGGQQARVGRADDCRDVCCRRVEGDEVEKRPSRLLIPDADVEDDQGGLLALDLAVRVVTA
jgi:hypothetical protein